MKDRRGAVLYVGKAKSLKKRLKQYFAHSADDRVQIPYLLSNLFDIETIVTASEKEALFLESRLIKRFNPKYNILLKDDKSSLHIRIGSDHPWPRIELVRSQGVETLGPRIFGPYASSAVARQMFDLAIRLFQIRQCSNSDFQRRKSPCLLYQLKRCSAPCVGKVSKSEYAISIKSASSLLSGRVNMLKKRFERKMQEASDRLEFEKADQFLQTLHTLEKVEKSKRQTRGETDVIGVWEEGELGAISILHYHGPLLVYGESRLFPVVRGLYLSETLEQLLIQYYTQKKQEGVPSVILLPPGEFVPEALSECLQELCGKKIVVKSPGEREKVSLAIENAQAAISQHIDIRQRKEGILEAIQQKLFLSKRPDGIDCFDASHCSGTDGVAACVSFVGGERNTNRYRTFIIRGKAGDDLAMLREAISRRYAKGDFPDLIIVDGGKEQLKAIKTALQSLSAPNIDVVAMAKELGNHSRGMTRESFYIYGSKEKIQFSSTSAELKFLQSVRDEAHRFVIAFHRKRRHTSTFSSQLLGIRGIGPKKRTKLLSAFQGIRELKKATCEEIRVKSGLSIVDAKRVESFFKEN